MSRRPDDGTKVYIGNLDERTTKRDLEDFFRNAGPLTDMWLARSPPGFAFVHFQDPRDAEDACRDLDGREILGRRVRVELSSGRKKQRDGPRDDKCYVCGTHGHMARDCRERGGSGRDRDRRSRSRSPPRRRSRSRERTDRDRSRSPRRSGGKDERERSRSPRADRERRRSRSPAKDAPAANGGDAPRD